MQLGAQQKAALARFRRSRDQLFNLWGVAGTGKTTLAERIAADTDGRVLVATNTNKAAQVLRGKGLPQAQTIHSLLYQPATRRACDCGGGFTHRRQCSALVAQFRAAPDPALRDAALLILDESSMIRRADAELLLSFGVPTLALGDPFQLPPVKGKSYFTDLCAPDYVLDEIHRQARDSPVIHLATRVRNGRTLRSGRYGDSLVQREDDPEFDPDHWDQVVVGWHSTRCAFNEAYRDAAGCTAELPEPGEVVLAKSNDKQLGILNGDLWTVDRARVRSKSVLDLELSDSNRRTRVSAWRAGFGGPDAWYALDNKLWEERRQHAVFQYGYAITCHSAQGSEWDRVVVRNEPPGGNSHARWLYTAITRAKDRVLVSTS